MKAYGAELVLVSRAQGMEGARDLAQQMAADGEGYVLDQFNNPDNPLAHYRTTGRKSGSRRTGVSRILSQLWAPPAPLPGWRVT